MTNDTLQSRKPRNGCLWVLVAMMGTTLAAILGLGILGFFAARAMHQARQGDIGMGVDEYPELDEIWSSGTGDTKVVTIPLRGMIVLGEESGLFGPLGGSAEMALRAIRRATVDPDVKGLILDIDSGGGGITASDILFQALMSFRSAYEGRKVVVLFGDVAASGAYYIALGGDLIMARPTSITGSIGVLIQTLNVRELAQKIGVKDVTIKSGRNKDMLNPLGDLTVEQSAMLQGIVNEMHARFAGIVADRRELSPAEVMKIADGRVFSAETARKLGLIDEIGYRDDAVAALADLLGAEDVKIFRYEEPFSFSALLKGVQRWQPMAFLRGGGDGPRLMYLWQP